MQQITKQVIKGLGRIGEEAGKELIKQSGEIAHGVITGKELVGDIKPISDQEKAQKQVKDDKEKEMEMAKLRAQINGRNIEDEIKSIRDKREQEEAEQERELERLAVEREQQKQTEALSDIDEVSSNPAKQKKKRGSAFAKGKQGKASTSDMSATAEYYKKPD
jgi:hypothetical protein